MTHVVVDTNPPRSDYTVGGTPQTVFSVPYAFFNFSDLEVYVGGVLKTLTTDYTVTGTAVDGGYQGGSVTLNVAVSNTTVSIVRNTPITRTTDFPYPSQMLNIEALNTQLDEFTAWAQQVDTDTGRTLKQPTSDPTAISPIPPVASRAGMFAAYDSNGNPIALGSLGLARGTWATATAYNQGDSVEDGAAGANTGNGYVCVVSHTSGTWSTDLAAGKWKLAVAAGAQGPAGASGTFVENTISANTSVGVGQTQQNYVCTAALTLTIAASTTLSTSWQNIVYAKGGAVMLALASGTDKINGGTAGASLAIVQGNYAVVTTDAAGNIYAEVANGPVTGSPTNARVLGLKVVNDGTTPNTKIDITATSALMVNATGGGIYATSVSVVIDLTTGTVTSAANGMDGEAVGTSAWLYLYLISNGTTTAALATKTSPLSGSPTMPSGYTYKAYVGAMRVDGSGNLMRTLQYGRRTQYTVVGSTNTANLPIMATGSAGSDTTPTWVAIATGAYVPATAGTINASIQTTNGATMVAPNNSYGAYNSTTNPPIGVVQISTGTPITPVSIILETSNIYWASNGGLVACAGWDDYAVAA